MLVEQLRKEWRAREHAMPINHAPSFTADGLVMGAGTVLVPATMDRCLQDLGGQEARVLALLSAAYGQAVPFSVLGSIERAAKRWAQGEDCLASIHLALAGLSRPEDRREAARRLFMADGLIKAGIAPEAILQALGSGADDEVFVRFDPGQLRVPSGNGVESGRWTKVGGVLRSLTRSAVRFLERTAAAQLAAAGARALASNPYVLAAGLVLIPKTTNLRVSGNVPEIPGLGYQWDSDTTLLQLTYAGPNGVREINATLEPDHLFRDGDKVVARKLPDGTVAVDPAEVSSDLADKDGPNLCPKPETDRPGRGDVIGAKDKDYEDQIKLLVNPDSPTPRGYGYKFWDPEEQDWVYIDDCQHQTGMRVEIKGDYAGVRSFPQGAKNITEDWLDQSESQLNVSKGFELTWVFALESDRDFAAELFGTARKGRERINLTQISRWGALQ